jgi:uncharacterized protein YecE (DUF72 family)
MVRMSAFVVRVPNSQQLTHEKNLAGCEHAALSFVRTMSTLGDKLGPLLLQLPPGFTAERAEVLDAFLRKLPEGLSYAV